MCANLAVCKARPKWGQSNATGTRTLESRQDLSSGNFFEKNQKNSGVSSGLILSYSPNSRFQFHKKEFPDCAFPACAFPINIGSNTPGLGQPHLMFSRWPAASHISPVSFHIRRNRFCVISAHAASSPRQQHPSPARPVKRRGKLLRSHPCCWCCCVVGLLG